jgi:hypothetical protein
MLQNSGHRLAPEQARNRLALWTPIKVPAMFSVLDYYSPFAQVALLNETHGAVNQRQPEL